MYIQFYLQQVTDINEVPEEYQLAFDIILTTFYVIGIYLSIYVTIHLTNYLCIYLCISDISYVKPANCYD
jgi:hypothetical protein